MTKSSNKLVLNAESFGFGPTAAIANIFPFLRNKFEHISYIGKGHTLDLQTSLPYDSIIDISGFSDEQITTELSKFDVFFTADDFEIAALANTAGLKTMIYDPLSWYWKEFPPIVKDCDLYIAQDFFGVKERLQKDAEMFPKNSQVVPPITLGKKQRLGGKYVLVNLGGLQNPFWSVSDTLNYAKLIIESIQKINALAGQELIFATSSNIAFKLNKPEVRSYSRAEFIKILENTKYAFMTSGLGNIYDAAEFNIPTAWLPAANDSQGQQLELLKQHNLSDAQIEWSDLGFTMDYFGTQQEVMNQITQAVQSISDSGKIQNLLEQAADKIKNMENSKTTELLNLFGTGGAEIIGNIIYENS